MTTFGTVELLGHVSCILGPKSDVVCKGIYISKTCQLHSEDSRILCNLGAVIFELKFYY